ncbi:MAG: YkgJ family cysteine cluster protein [Alphaproteobacteria bacterium]
MAQGTRTQRRAFRRQIKTARQSVKREGLPLNQDHTAMAALAHMLRGKFLEKENPGRAVDVARMAAEAFEISLEKNTPVKPIDCKMGCTYCCSRMVGVSAPEAFWVAEQISSGRGGSVQRDNFLERAKRTISAKPQERKTERMLCALLDEGACAIYSARPLACRANASHSVTACREAFEGKDANIPAPRVHFFLGDRCRMAIYVALRSLGFPAVSYELSEAVSVILSEDNACERWYGGEDIFANVQAPPDRSAEMDAVITEISQAIAF